MIARRLLLGLLLLCSPWNALADDFRPAYLEIRPLQADEYSLLWKVPAQGEGARLALDVLLPEGVLESGPRSSRFVNNAHFQEWRIRATDGLIGQSFCLSGQAQGVTDVLVRVQRTDGSEQLERMSPGADCFEVKAAMGGWEVAWSYGVLGVEHILGGIDHLLFVLTLLLLVRGLKRILITVTAFTLAHSLTLVAATLGWAHVPGPPVEAVIALSIVFVAAEIVRSRRGSPGITERSPWIVAFSFGLLHGFGFAGALAEVGLPDSAIPLALLCFNLGVEVGQLIFVLAVTTVIAVWQRWLKLPVPAWAAAITPYAIGSIAMFWTFERIAAF